jgi:hypothetical protein
MIRDLGLGRWNRKFLIDQLGFLKINNYDHPLPITHYLSPITYHLSPITYHPLPITYHPLPITHYLSPITYHPLPLFFTSRRTTRGGINNF